MLRTSSPISVVGSQPFPGRKRREHVGQRGAASNGSREFVEIPGRECASG